MGFVAAALCGLAIAQQSPVPQKIWQGFGVNIHTTELAPGEVTLLRASGVEYVRMDFNWETTEKALGQYDFSAYDKLVGTLKSANIRPFFVLNHANKLYEAGAPSTDKAQNAFAAWSAAATTHFKDTEVLWEIWNEPNVDQFWKPRVSSFAYTSLAVKTAKAMKAANPDCRVIAPGVSSIDEAFLRRAMTTELLGLIDGVSVHPYRASGPETVMKDYVRVKNVIRANAPAGREDLPVICSEWGYSTHAKSDVNEDRQAMYLAKLWLLSAASGCPVTIYHDWKDSGSNPFTKEHRFGIIRQNLTPKPAYNAARLVVKAFKGCSIFKRMEKKDPLDWVILGVGDGKMVRATWYQKVGIMPKFEAYDMSDKANRTLYNRVMDESRNTTQPRVDATQPKIEPITQPKTEPKTNNTNITIKPIQPKNNTPNVKTLLNLAFAPPMDEDGWCAVIQKPTGMASAKVEFRYERKGSGAKVTCFATVSGERTVEPLANMDNEATILALVGGQKVGEMQVQCANIDLSQHELRAYKGSDFSTSSIASVGKGGLANYSLSSEYLQAGIAPTKETLIPDGAKSFVIWVKPDGSNNNLYARLKDEAGTVFQIFLGSLDKSADKDGWRAVVIPLQSLSGAKVTTIPSNSSAPQGRLKWDHVLFVEAADRNQPKSGKIEFGPAAYEF